MSVEQRLSDAQAALNKRGVTDVKFFYRDLGKPFSEVAAHAADILEAVVNGRSQELRPLGDSTRSQ